MIELKKKNNGNIILSKIEQGQKFVDVARNYPMHRVFAKTVFSEMPTSIIDELGCHIYYDENGIVKEIEIFPESELVISGINIFKLPKKRIRAFENLEQNDGNFTIQIPDTDILLQVCDLEDADEESLDSVVISF